MPKTFYTLLFSLLLTMQAISQQTLRGTILSSDNNPLIGATILAKNSTGAEIGTTSDANGSFTLSLTDPATYDLKIDYLGYSQSVIQVDATSGKDINLGSLFLIESNELLQTVEVVGRRRKDYNSDYSFSGSKVAILNKEMPQAISTVTKELLSDRQAFQLVDAVKTVSNVAATGIYNHYNIRGITQADDGQVVNGLRTRQYYFLQPITAHLERVEVIKGPSSVTFSSADPGGTVNMVTKKPLKEKQGSVSLSAGSFSTMRAAIDFTGPLNESKTLLYRVNAAYQEAKSFRDVVDNNAFLFTPSLSYIPNESTALNVEMIYNNSVGNLDRGQPIFGAINGEFDINSTPTTLNVGAANDHYENNELMFTANFSKKFTSNLGFNAQYMKQTWEEDLAEHRFEGSIVDIEGNVIPTLARLRYDRRTQFWETDNLSAYFDYTIERGNITNKILVGYDATRWERKTGAGFLRARRYETLSGGQSNFNPDNAANFQTIEVNGITIPKPSAAFFDLENPFNGARNTNAYNLSEIKLIV